MKLFLILILSNFLVSQDYIVEAGNMYYSPQSLEIEVGETVQWYNENGYHDVVITSGPEILSLPPVSGPNIIGSLTFTTPGTYEYICSIGSHANMGMVGTIVVNEPLEVDYINIPSKNNLQNIYPNPFNPLTNINYTLIEKSNIKLSIYNSLGSKVITLKEGNVEAGNYYVSWDASKYPSGVYFLKLDVNDSVEIKKMILLK